MIFNLILQCEGKIPGENSTNYYAFTYKILCLVFERYVNIVLVCEHFYHNVWYATDGLKGIFEFMLATLKSFQRIRPFLNEDIYFVIQILCSFSENFGQLLRATSGKMWSNHYIEWLKIRNLNSNMSRFNQLMHTIAQMVRLFPVHPPPLMSMVW